MRNNCIDLSDVKKTHTEKTMWAQLSEDLSNAEFRLWIQSPFIAQKRMEFFWYRLEQLVKRGVCVCIFLQDPKTWFSAGGPTHHGFDALVAKLRELNVHVTVREFIHEKLIIIDDRIHWDGSCNYMSHSVTTDRIHRWTHLDEMLEAIETHELDGCLECKENYKIVFCERNKSNVGRKLKQLRTRAGLTQRELAERCNVTQSVVSRVEMSDPGNLILENLEQIAAGLHYQSVLLPVVLVPRVAKLTAQYYRWHEQSSVVPINLASSAPFKHEMLEALEIHELDGCLECRENYRIAFGEPGKSRIGGNLKQIRQKAGLTQQELAERCKTTQYLVSRVEKGDHSNLTMESLDKIAEGLQYQPILLPESLIPRVAKLITQYYRSHEQSPVVTMNSASGRSLKKRIP